MARVRVREVSDEAAPGQGPQRKTDKSRQMKKPSRKLLVGLAAAIFVTAIIAALINDRNRLSEEVERLSSVSLQNQEVDEAEQLKSEVGQYLELPIDETPTIATVSDVSKLQGQQFFANAQEGDKVLLFAKAGKAILYRPSTKKIIEVAPINLDNPAAQGGTTQQGPNTQ